MKIQQVCYDRREIEQGVIKFVTNVKSDDSASVLWQKRDRARSDQVCYKCEEYRFSKCVMTEER